MKRFTRNRLAIVTGPNRFERCDGSRQKDPSHQQARQIKPVSHRAVEASCNCFTAPEMSFGSHASAIATQNDARTSTVAALGRRSSVLFIGAYPASARGSRGVSEDVCLHLTAAGWETRIVSRHSTRVGRLSEMVWSCWQERGRYRVAAIDLYSGQAFLWALLACWILRSVRTPFVLMLHGGNLPKFAARRPDLVRGLLASACVVTAPSDYLADQMRKYRSDIRVLPNGINVDRYHFRLRSRVAPRLIWLRAFHEVYDPKTAVQTVALLKQDFPDVHLTMIGPDKGDGSFENTQLEVDRLGLATHFTLKGSVPKKDVPACLADGDIFLNTSLVDNTPVSILEAMASGMCIVSTNVGGIPYLLKAGHEALLVSPGDPEKMAEAVRQILQDPELARRLSRNAHSKAQVSDWSAVVPQWQDLLDSVVLSSGTTQ